MNLATVLSDEVVPDTVMAVALVNPNDPVGPIA